MSYASLVSLAQTIDKLLQDHDRYSISPPEKEQIISIHERVIFLLAFLEDFREELANNLEGRMRDLANEAEDIIEDFMSEQIRRYLFLEHQNIKDGMYMKLKKIRKEIDSIKGEVAKIKNGAGTTQDVQQSADSKSSGRLVHTRKYAMVGFEDDLMAIKSRLRGESSSLELIPIFGMGGIGKTTLARNAFDDPLSVERFDIRAWVTVSQNYSARAILSDLLVSVKGGSFGQSDESQMAENVYKSLKGRRYLIVMDDMWSTEPWDAVRRNFPNDNNGSRIILTTRLRDVAAYPDSSGPLHEMHFMDSDQSWNLLQQKVFAQENCPPELETVGKTIARSCRGLPLAIVVIAGILSAVGRTQTYWENIERNVNQVVRSTNDEHLAKVISLSYNHLPQHLKPSFLYLGIYPEDYEIHVSELIKLWVAEGFSKPEGSKSSEEVAEEYLEDLVKRSLVLAIKRNTWGKVTRCSLHDVLRDLCIRKAQEEKFLLHIKDGSSKKSTRNQRRISIAHSFDQNFLKEIYNPTIRTIQCFYAADSSLDYIGNFGLLRVLVLLWSDPPYCSDFAYRRLIKIPAELFELFHLRYLCCFVDFVEFPGAISNLQNLQTLIICTDDFGFGCRCYLPRQIWRMPQLRHIILSDGVLEDPEKSTFPLENLQTLWMVKNIDLTERIVKMIPNLKKLGIVYYWTTELQKNYHLENLVYLEHLKILKLEVCWSLDGIEPKLNPVFPIGLKKLVLYRLQRSWKDIGKIVGLLPNLEVLKLKLIAFDGDKWETSEGQFLQLKYLGIYSSDLKHWITESNHFPSLRRLGLHQCMDLRVIPEGIGEISTLELIEIDKWNKSLLDSAKRIQEEQLENWGNHDLQVRVMRYN